MQQFKLLKLLGIIILFFIIHGCYIPNDPPRSEFSFGFPGRVERLEDAFYSLKLDYEERDLTQHVQKSPEYEFTIVRSDTTINYTVILEDCQSIYYLVKYNDNWNCDSSYIHIMAFSSNIYSLSRPEAESIFRKEIIDRVSEKFNSLKDNYHWVIEKSRDTTFVKILNQQDSLRKLYIYSLDTVNNSMAEKEIINYFRDSTVIYQKDPVQRFVYLKCKKVIPR